MAVDAKNSEFTMNCERWERSRDASMGQHAVHAKRTRYLPQLKGQTIEEYDSYLRRALYYNATGRTIDSMSGLIFRRPPKVEIPEAAQYLQDDIDTSGTPLTAFSENVVEELLQVGRIGLLTEYPTAPGIRTQAEEQAAGVRPYIKTYCAESLINWRVERIGNRSMLTMAVLFEHADEVADEYTTKKVEQWRVLKLGQGVDESGKPLGSRIYTQEVWQKAVAVAGVESQFILKESLTPLMGGKPMLYIPFLVCGPMGVDFAVKKPPILDLADVNLSHYQSTADYEHGLHFTGLPTPYVTGHTFEPGQTVALGSTDMLAFRDPQSQVGFLEFKGEGLKQLSNRLLEKENMMAALGARLLVAEKRAAETAETAAIHRSGENSVLASLAIAASMAITQSINWALEWAGLTPDAKVELNTDYLVSGLTAGDLTALVATWQAGGIAKSTLYDNLQRGEIARQNVSFEDEEAEIALEGPPLGVLITAGTGGGVNPNPPLV